MVIRVRYTTPHVQRFALVQLIIEYGQEHVVIIVAECAAVEDMVVNNLLWVRWAGVDAACVVALHEQVEQFLGVGECVDVVRFPVGCA